MIFAQTVCILSVLQAHPEGISLDGLIEDLKTKYSTSEAVRFLLSTNSLSTRLNDLSPCLILQEGKYFYVENSERYSNHDLTDRLLKERQAYAGE